MLQLNPAEMFPIVRVLENPAITDTHYVQAVIRNADTDAVLATVNLDDKGDRRFHKLYRIPHDNTFARGRYIVITTSVYTDSGYTVRSENYGDKADTYLVQERYSFGANYGGGSSGIDEATLRKVVKELLKEEMGELKELEPVKFPDPIDDKALAASITSSICAYIDAAIGGIPTPEKPEKVDLRSLEQAIQGVLTELRSRPKFKEQDLSPIATALNALAMEFPSLASAIDAGKQEIMAHIDETVVPVMEETAQQRVIDGIRNGQVDLSLKSKGDANKKTNALKRLAMKNNLPV